MASAQEHMIADFTRALEEGGVEIVLDGTRIRAFAPPEEISPSEFERSVIIRRRLVHLRGAVADKVPGQVVMVDGVRWEVVSHTLFSFSASLLLQRHSG